MVTENGTLRFNIYSDIDILKVNKLVEAACNDKESGDDELKSRGWRQAPSGLVTLAQAGHEPER